MLLFMNNDNYTQKERSKKSEKIVITTKTALFIGIILLVLITVVCINLFGKGGNFKNGLAAGEKGQFSINTGKQNNPEQFVFDTEAFEPQDNFQQELDSPLFAVASEMQTVTVFDHNAGCNIFNINLPAGWTHKFQSQWSKETIPMVMYSFIAESSDKSSVFCILPGSVFIDNHMINGKVSGAMKIMSPREYAEYLLESMQKTQGYEDITYQFLKEYPDDITSQLITQGTPAETSLLAYELNMQNKLSTILLKITVFYMPNNQGQTTWGTEAVVLKSPKNDSEAVSQKLLAPILTSIKLDPLWRSKMQTMTKTWAAENKNQKRNLIQQIQSSGYYQLRAQQEVFAPSFSH